MDHSVSVIAAGLLRNDDSVLLVEQQGPHDVDSSWALPGGQVQDGELFTEALIREVKEETGLDLTVLEKVIYTAQIVNAATRSQEIVIVFEAARWTGRLIPNDPDGFIKHAGFYPVADAIKRLEQNPWRTMSEPTIQYLKGQSESGSAWFYRVETDGFTISANILHP